MLKGLDDRSLTETNIAAIEKGIEKILDGYRKKLSNSLAALVLLQKIVQYYLKV